MDTSAPWKKNNTGTQIGSAYPRLLRNKGIKCKHCSFTMTEDKKNVLSATTSPAPGPRKPSAPRAQPTPQRTVPGPQPRTTRPSATAPHLPRVRHQLASGGSPHTVEPKGAGSSLTKQRQAAPGSQQAAEGRAGRRHLEPALAGVRMRVPRPFPRLVSALRMRAAHAGGRPRPDGERSGRRPLGRRGW